MKNIFSLIQLALVTFTLSVVFQVTSPIFIYAIAGGVFAVSVAIGNFKHSPDSRFHLFNDISIQQARAMFTSITVAIYNETPVVMSFLRSFFTPVYTNTRYVNIEVIRNHEKCAVDVIRGSGPLMKKKTKSSQRVMDPPFYHLGHNVNELDVYDRAIGSPNESDMMDLSRQSAEVLVGLVNDIERSHEKQASEVMMTGIIELVNGDNIDFGRQAYSLVNLGVGNYWSVPTVDPTVALKNAGEVLRQKGKAQGDTYNVIMGENAFMAMKANPIFQSEHKLVDISLGQIRMPQRNSVGGTLHGQLSAGSYKFNVWTYIEGYEDENGNFIKYIDDKKIVVLPDNPNFIEASAKVPMLLGDPAFVSAQKGKYVLKDYIDANHTNHRQEVMNATIMVPVALDQIYTAQVIA